MNEVPADISPASAYLPTLVTLSSGSITTNLPFGAGVVPISDCQLNTHEPVLCVKVVFLVESL